MIEKMAYLGSSSIENLIKNSKVILPFKAGRIKSGAYELSLGNEIFQTDSKSGKREILKDEKEQIVINPGQFSLLLTEETVSMPLNKIAFISIKAGIKLKGLINVSGFHVDPGFQGKLVFSVYNAGSGPISLEKGEPCFLIWFAELNETEATKYNGEHKEQTSIPIKYIDALKAGEIASPNALSERIDKLDLRKTYTQWLLFTLIAITSGIALKLYWDFNRYKEGVESGYKMKGQEITLDSTVKIIHHELDSLRLEIKRVEKHNSEFKNQSDGKKK
jgi:dCTP deaminase